MSFNSLLNLTCDIQEYSETQDSAGQMIKSWSDVATNIPCRIDAMGGGLIEEPEVIYEAATHLLFCNDISGVSLSVHNHRVVVGSDTYKIIRVEKVYGYSNLHHLEVYLEIVT